MGEDDDGEPSNADIFESEEPLDAAVFNRNSSSIIIINKTGMSMSKTRPGVNRVGEKMKKARLRRLPAKVKYSYTLFRARVAARVKRSLNRLRNVREKARRQRQLRMVHSVAGTDKDEAAGGEMEGKPAEGGTGRGGGGCEGPEDQTLKGAVDELAEDLVREQLLEELAQMEMEAEGTCPKGDKGRKKETKGEKETAKSVREKILERYAWRRSQVEVQVEVKRRPPPSPVTRRHLSEASSRSRSSLNNTNTVEDEEQDIEEEEVNPLADAFLCEPIPYRSAVAEGASHVIVLRTRPDPCEIELRRPGVYERAVAKPFFRRYGTQAPIDWMFSLQHHKIYAQDGKVRDVLKVCIYILKIYVNVSEKLLY